MRQRAVAPSDYVALPESDGCPIVSSSMRVSSPLHMVGHVRTRTCIWLSELLQPGCRPGNWHVFPACTSKADVSSVELGLQGSPGLGVVIWVCL